MNYFDSIKNRSKEQLDFCDKNKTELRIIGEKIHDITRKDDPHKIHEFLLYELEYMYNLFLNHEASKAILKDEAKSVNIN